jgi:hypothetical protein
MPPTGDYVTALKLPTDSCHGHNSIIRWLCHRSDATGGGGGVSLLLHNHRLIEGGLPPAGEVAGYTIHIKFDRPHPFAADSICPEVVGKSPAEQDPVLELIFTFLGDEIP